MDAASGRDDEGFYTYREFADAIVKYVKDMGYTHVDLWEWRSIL